MIYYFSGAGNSYWVARELGKRLNTAVTPITSYLFDEEVDICDDVVGIVCPTHMDDAPWVVKQFLLKLNIYASNPYVFAVMTYNERNSGEGFASIDRGLHANQSALSAKYLVQMPGICKPSASDADCARLAAAPERTAHIAQEVAARTVNFASDGRLPEADYVQGSHLYKSDALLKRFKVTDACTGCGTCVVVCPVDNVFVYSGQALHGDLCATCYACVHWCPEHATVVKVPILRDMRQYHHPEVTLDDLRPQNAKKCSLSFEG